MPRRSWIEGLLARRSTSWGGASILLPLLFLLLLFGYMPKVKAISREVIQEWKQFIDIKEPEFVPESIDQMDDTGGEDDDDILPPDKMKEIDSSNDGDQEDEQREITDPKNVEIIVQPDRPAPTIDQSKVTDLDDSDAPSDDSQRWYQPTNQTTTQINPDHKGDHKPQQPKNGSDGVDVSDDPGGENRGETRQGGNNGSGLTVTLDGLSGPGLGLSGPGNNGDRGLSVKGQRISDWILKNQGPIPRTIATKMHFDESKGDVSALTDVTIVLDTATDRFFRLFFVYRKAENHLSFCVVEGDHIYKFSLPSFELQERYVEEGSVELTPEGDIYGVNLFQIDAIDDSVREAFQVVLAWLEVV